MRGGTKEMKSGECTTELPAAEMIVTYERSA
jgi:hypothetical protein